MAIDSSVPRTRRALLLGGLGGLAAVVAAALGRPLPARAADGDVVLVGEEYQATSVTKITQTSATAVAIEGTSPSGAGIHGVSSSGTGVWGTAGSGPGVDGSSTSGPGVSGKSIYGDGVRGESQTYVGIDGHSESYLGVRGSSVQSAAILGESAAADRPAVIGRSMGNHTGVVGQSGGSGGAPSAAVAKTGVYGYATQDANARGVYGRSTAGRGVHGYATTGTGVLAQSADPLKGYALRALGRVKLDHCAGVATIAAGSKSRTVTPGIDLTPTSAVVATLQGNAGSETTTVSRVFVNASTNAFTIYLTKAATQDVKVAWHVFD